jgi:hypothetical protein
MHYTIYKITNLINNKIYIGKHQTQNLNDSYMGSGKHLKRAIRKHGIENFTKEILFQFDNEADMNAKEAELVTKDFCLREDTYNICVGGQGGFSYLNNSNKSNIGWKTNISGNDYQRRGGIAHSQKIATDLEYRKSFISKVKLNLNPKAFLGKTHTDEWKQNHSTLMKEKQKGSKNSQYGTMWITNGQENKKIKKDIDFVPEGWYKGRK